ncbi:kinesin-like protein Klp8 [Borealophlyctis nickersoniae]|nr:kinesin-like protein Klp8 [Borealophlyctis nickersoniae]
MSSVKVVVRVRPFNQREIDRDCKCIINMQGPTAVITRPSEMGHAEVSGRTSVAEMSGRVPGADDTKTFTYDECYWSFGDPTDPEFASQETVYNSIGRELLDHAFQGYNTCIFAYGQTGSGKSYTMMGYKSQKGLIPRACDELFTRIENAKNDNLSFRVEVSYLEIYNEKVRDLINPGNKSSLRVREHPLLGPYVEDLTKMIVSSYADIAAVMDVGNRTRTVAATNMNETSSRSHAVFTVILTQQRKDPSSGLQSNTVSRICLVDLAGSERADATGATGQRLKEGANINKSLTTLGKVISQLAEGSANGGSLGTGANMSRRRSDASDHPPSGSSKRSTWSGNGSLSRPKKAADQNGVFVPYRDSTLTWLLKDCLGGNSKTVMIAAISPADVNYEETLSTLRYAERAKRIVNKAIVNEDANGKLMRELQEELESLKEKLAAYEKGQASGSPGAPNGETVLPPDVEAIVQEQDEQISTLADQLQATEKLMVEIAESYEEKLRKTQEMQVARDRALETLGISIQAGHAPGVSMPKKLPHLLNLNEDPLMSECLLYQLSSGITYVGDRPDATIPLSGHTILPHHCHFVSDETGSVTLHVEKGALVYVNGRMVTGSKRLKSGYRVIIGEHHVFRFNNPEEVRRERTRSSGLRRPANLGLATDHDALRPGSLRPSPQEDFRSDTPESSSTSSDISVASALIDWSFAQREREINQGRRERPLSMMSSVSDEAYDSISEISRSSEMQTHSVIKDIEERLKTVRDREVQRLLEENLTVSREIVEMEAKLDKDKRRLKELEEKMSKGANGDAGHDNHGPSSHSGGMVGDPASNDTNAAHLEVMQEELRRERERVRMMEEDIKLEKERMQRTIELQKLNYEAKIRKLSKRYKSSGPSMSTRERSLAIDVLVRWRSRCFVSLAQTILASGVMLKEANIIAKELHKGVLFQFAVLDHSRPMRASFWEGPSARSSPESIARDAPDTLAGYNLPRPYLAVKVLDGRNNSIYFWSYEELRTRLTRMRALYNVAERPRELLAQRTGSNEEAFYNVQKPWFDFIGTGFVSLRNLVTGITRERQCCIVECETGDVRGWIRVVVSPIGSETFVKGSEDEFEDDEEMGESGVTYGNGVEKAESPPTAMLQIGADLLFEVSILEIGGIPESEYTQLHCQFRVSDLSGDDDVNGEDDENHEISPPVGARRSVRFAQTQDPERVVKRGAAREGRVFATDPVADFGEGPAQFEFSQTVRLKVTPKVRDVVANGALSFEVFGRRRTPVSELIKKDHEGRSEPLAVGNMHVAEGATALESKFVMHVHPADSDEGSEPKSPTLSVTSGPSLQSHSSSLPPPSPINALPPPESHDILAEFQILEFSRATGDFKYTPVESAGDVNTFLLRQGLQRRVFLSLSHTSGKDFPWTRISEIRIGSVRRVDARGNDPDDDGNLDSAVERKMLPLILPEGHQRIKVHRNGTSTLEVECAWDSSVHESQHLNRATKGNARIVMSLEWTVDMKSEPYGPSLSSSPMSAVSNAAPSSSAPASKLGAPLRFKTDFSVRVFERDFKVKAMTKIALMGLISGSGLRSKYSQRLSIVYAVDVSAQEPLRKRKCWAQCDTRNDYVRGEECLGGWKPRGQEVLLQWWEAREKRRKNLDMEIVRGLLEETEAGTGLRAGEHGDFEKHRVIVATRCLEVWRRRRTGDIGLDVLLRDDEEPLSYRSNAFPARSLPLRWTAEVHQVKGGPVAQCGYLFTPEDGGDTWVKRWFVIRRPILYMYVNNAELDLVSVVGLSNVTVQYTRDLWSILQREHVFALYTKYHSVLLQANSEEDMKEWVGTIDPLHVGAVLSLKGKIEVEGDI